MLKNDYAKFLLGNDCLTNENHWEINTGKHGEKCVICVPTNTLVKTKYGYGLVLNKLIVWLKDWQISKYALVNGSFTYCNELPKDATVPIVVNEQYFNPHVATSEFKNFVNVTSFDELCKLAQIQNIRAWW